MIQSDHDSKEIAENERIVSFARGPPIYDGNDSNFITRIKEDLGIQVGCSEFLGQEDVVFYSLLICFHL